eukprot:14465789-Alexandrium_andersonii.AAC.1
MPPLYDRLCHALKQARYVRSRLHFKMAPKAEPRAGPPHRRPRFATPLSLAESFVNARHPVGSRAWATAMEAREARKDVRG